MIYILYFILNILFVSSFLWYWVYTDMQRIVWKMAGALLPQWKFAQLMNSEEMSQAQRDIYYISCLDTHFFDFGTLLTCTKCMSFHLSYIGGIILWSGLWPLLTVFPSAFLGYKFLEWINKDL